MDNLSRRKIVKLLLAQFNSLIQRYCWLLYFGRRINHHDISLECAVRTHSRSGIHFMFFFSTFIPRLDLWPKSFKSRKKRKVSQHRQHKESNTIVCSMCARITSVTLPNLLLMAALYIYAKRDEHRERAEERRRNFYFYLKMDSIWLSHTFVHVQNWLNNSPCGNLKLETHYFASISCIISYIR